jgi:hypothetical protein
MLHSSKSKRKVELLRAFQTGRRKRASTFYLVAGSREGTRNIKKKNTQI